MFKLLMISTFCFVAVFGAELGLNNVRIPKGYKPLGRRVGAEGRASFFIVSKRPTTWHNARHECTSTGQFRLVSIEDRETAREIYSFLASGGHKEAWTSGNDLLVNGEYEWLELGNKPFGEFQDWRTGAPPLNPDCQCVSVSALAGQCGDQCIGKWGWDEEDCALKKHAVCEFSE